MAAVANDGIMSLRPLPRGSRGTPGQPGLQFDRRPGQVHGSCGLSVHQAAALRRARRLLGCAQRIPRRWARPTGNDVHVAFTAPVRKRVKHVWTCWGAVSRQLRPALAAQHRRGSGDAEPIRFRLLCGRRLPRGPGCGLAQRSRSLPPRTVVATRQRPRLQRRLTIGL